MGRLYIATISISTATAARDIFEILAASGKPVCLHEILLTTDVEKDATEEQIALTLKRVTGAPTSGSGGGTPTMVPVSPNDTAAGVTIETGNTTQLSGGTSVTLSQPYMNNRVGWHYLSTPEARITIDASTRLVLSQAAISTTAAIGGHVVVEELI